MRLSSIFSFVGFVLLFAGTYCPLLRPFHLFNWNVYQLNKPYGIVLLLVAVIGIISSFLNQHKITRAAAWTSLTLVVLLLIAAVIKVETTFSFIPFHKFDSLLTRQIKFKWGWFVLFAGPVLALIGALSGKPKNIAAPPEAV
jgi:predicted membrane channel-forming protein YqfA (hemolysin III family)